MAKITGKKRQQCDTCLGCTRNDCGECRFCKDKPKFGGPGKKKQCCEKRRRVNIISRSVPITLDTMSVRPSTSEVSSYNSANMLCIMIFRLWQ